MTRCASMLHAWLLLGLIAIYWIITAVWLISLNARLTRLESRPSVRIEHVTVTNARDVSAAVAGLTRGALPPLEDAR